MRKVFLITGFQNWGKTFLIQKMFKRTKYFYDKQYKYLGYNFCVQSQSNDDLGKDGFEKIMNQRISALLKNGINPTHICAAFCPTKEDKNLSDEIIQNLFPNDEVHIIAIEYKWCLHAKLQIKEIENYYSHLKNVKVYVLSEKDQSKKSSALNELLKLLL